MMVITNKNMKLEIVKKAYELNPNIVDNVFTQSFNYY